MSDRDDLLVTAPAPANGGDAIARDPDGRVVFVRGALPGERVTIIVDERRKDFLRGTVVAIFDPSPDRTEPPCPYVAVGCGGCDLQHLAPAAQPGFKRDIVADSLRRLAHLDDARVDAAPPMPATGYRTTVRAAVAGDEPGHTGFRRRWGHDVVPVGRCLVAHPAVEALLVGGRFAGCGEVTIRVGAATGERLVVASPAAGGVVLPAELAAGTTVVGDDELDGGRRAWIHEEVAGRRFRISARSFFQARPDGAAALVDEVRRAGGGRAGGGGPRRGRLRRRRPLRRHSRARRCRGRRRGVEPRRRSPMPAAT